MDPRPSSSSFSGGAPPVAGGAASVGAANEHVGQHLQAGPAGTSAAASSSSQPGAPTANASSSSSSSFLHNNFTQQMNLRTSLAPGAAAAQHMIRTSFAPPGSTTSAAAAQLQAGGSTTSGTLMLNQGASTRNSFAGNGGGPPAAPAGGTRNSVGQEPPSHQQNNLPTSDNDGDLLTIHQRNLASTNVRFSTASSCMGPGRPSFVEDAQIFTPLPAFNQSSSAASAAEGGPAHRGGPPPSSASRGLQQGGATSGPTSIVVTSGPGAAPAFGAGKNTNGTTSNAGNMFSRNNNGTADPGTSGTGNRNYRNNNYPRTHSPLFGGQNSSNSEERLRLAAGNSRDDQKFAGGSSSSSGLLNMHNKNSNSVFQDDEDHLDNDMMSFEEQQDCSADMDVQVEQMRRGSTSGMHDHCAGMMSSVENEETSQEPLIANSLPPASQILAELDAAVEELRDRGLYRAAQWAAELAASVEQGAVEAAGGEENCSSASFLWAAGGPPSAAGGGFGGSSSSSRVDPPNGFGNNAGQGDRFGNNSSSSCKRGPNVKMHRPEDERRIQRTLTVARSHFELRQYQRAHSLLANVKPQSRLTAKGVFLKYYSLYLIGEQRKEQEINESEPSAKLLIKNKELETIEEHLGFLLAPSQPVVGESASKAGINTSSTSSTPHPSEDPHCLYLRGLVLKQLQQTQKAREAFASSLKKFPWNWSCWLDYLQTCLSDEEEHQAGAPATTGVRAVSSSVSEAVQKNTSWVKFFFQAALSLDLQHYDQALEIYHYLLEERFFESSYLLSQIAITLYNMKEYDASLENFERMRLLDPHKMESLDTYSNILYVKDNSPALGHLAKQVIKSSKYTPEACCIIGNFFSLKGEHEKAVSYFHRALQINRQFVPGYILMGHEFMEMKNSALAVDAYRQALLINKRDYRAWYGIGQVYELLNLYSYACYYYLQAMRLRPKDSRMWNALAGCYENLNLLKQAITCFERAHKCGDSENLALPKLARLHAEDQNSESIAAEYYQLLLQGDAFTGIPQSLSLEAVEALRFLMQYCRKINKIPECAEYAKALLDTNGPEREEAKLVLRELQEEHGGY
ncbi:unnamed protein product [Amoebophrya sp. A120]|nr:unnamed protein product [Amoebophrya sp. A120]|eukprot:GSA120T00019896001.1